MDGSYKILEHLIHTTIQVTNFQKIRLEELIAKDFPFKHSRQVIDVLLVFDKEIIADIGIIINTNVIPI